MAAFGFVRPYSAAPAGGPTKVWFVGDSEMRGMIYIPETDSWECRGGLRPHVWAALTEAGADPDFRGHLLNSDDGVADAGHSHSGANGAHGTVWQSSYFDTYAPALFPTPADAPHVVGIAVGTNDADDAATATDFSRLMDKAASYFPRANILFATAPRTATPGTFDAQAAQVRIEVAARRAAGMNVRLVDVHGIALRAADFSDGVHGSDAGYAKIGALWARELLNVVAPRFLG